MSYPSKNTTKIGYVNKNGQVVVRDTGEVGTDFGARNFQLACSCCGHNYGANSGDIWERKCPRCQGGREGLPLGKRRQSGKAESHGTGVASFFGAWPGEEADDELQGSLQEMRDSQRR